MKEQAVAVLDRIRLAVDGYADKAGLSVDIDIFRDEGDRALAKIR